MSKFAFLFEEGEGYLFVNNIGHPTNGEGQLVRSVADVTTCNEVKLYRPHSNIPNLIDWADEVYSELESDRRQRSTASIWQYCNGGDLAALFAKACETEVPLPEAFLWKLLLEVLTTLDFLHFGCQPAICQGDLHSNNIFLHWEDDSTILPKIKLGDFGLARSYDNWTGGIDFLALKNFLTNLKKQKSASWVPTPPSQELMSAIDAARELYQQMSSSNADVPVFIGGHRHVRTHITSLIQRIRPQYQVSLTSMSNQERENMLRLKPDMDTRVLMCDSPEALFTFGHYTGEHYDEPEIPSGPCKIVQVDADANPYQVIRVVGDAGIEAIVLPFDPETYEDLDDEDSG